MALAAGAVTVLVAGSVTAFLFSSAAQTPRCPAVQRHPEWSVARRWDESLLDAIRRALPAPTVHARNLFHTSAAMWDAWQTKSLEWLAAQGFIPKADAASPAESSK